MNQTDLSEDRPGKDWARSIDPGAVAQRIEDINVNDADTPFLGYPSLQSSGYDGEDELIIFYREDHGHHPHIPNREVDIPSPRRMPMRVNIDNWSPWRLPRIDPIEIAVDAEISPPRMGRREIRMSSYLFNHHHSHCAFFIGTSCAQAVMDVLDGPTPEKSSNYDPNNVTKQWHMFLASKADSGLYEIWEGRVADDPAGRSVYVIQFAPVSYSINKGIWYQEKRGAFSSGSIRWDQHERSWDVVEIDGFTLNPDLLLEPQPDVVGYIHDITVQPDAIKGTLDNLTLDEDVVTHDLELISPLEKYHPADGFVPPDAYDELLSVGARPIWDARDLSECIGFLKGPDQVFLLTHLVAIPAPLGADGLTAADAQNVDYMLGKGPDNIVDKIIDICDIQNDNDAEDHVSLALTQLRRKMNKIIAYQLDIAAGGSPDGSQRI